MARLDSFDICAYAPTWFDVCADVNGWADRDFVPAPVIPPPIPPAPPPVGPPVPIFQPPGAGGGVPWDYPAPVCDVIDKILDPECREEEERKRRRRRRRKTRPLVDELAELSPAAEPTVPEVRPETPVEPPPPEATQEVTLTAQTEQPKVSLWKWAAVSVAAIAVIGASTGKAADPLQRKPYTLQRKRRTLLSNPSRLSDGSLECRCVRCDHRWVARGFWSENVVQGRDSLTPKVCPKCRTPYWRGGPKVT